MILQKKCCRRNVVELAVISNNPVRIDNIQTKRSMQLSLNPNSYSWIYKVQWIISRELIHAPKYGELMKNLEKSNENKHQDLRENPKREKPWREGERIPL